MAGRVQLVLLLALLALSARAAEAGSPARRLLQRGWGGGWSGGDQQLWAQRAAATQTRNAIRTAVATGGSFEATRYATNTGQVTSALATYDPCALTWGGPGCYGGWGWGRRLRAAAGLGGGR
ncbi:hypothetical protein Rsub_08315 [Raphidocelis subcapitata]|uniref:Uncharacterized protein n=1 Tax=Raphidocelis subcapitata TaxID=307507 RepID=A0A2V0P5Y3_9CHLO|nr:hypothetical protein Rsub_08315 [Raphidocelis subcapitata]|eukprot:GBF95284.1 hypothetical protein Rsub_08315 [Raphidocelis subcapitata]